MEPDVLVGLERKQPGGDAGFHLFHMMRTLAVSLGNTSVFVGVAAERRIVQTFRLRPEELRELPARVRGRIDRAVACSVVPDTTPKLKRAIARAWKIEVTELNAPAAHGLAIGYRRPAELGADRIAAALGAREKFPRENLIVVDCGTATTVTALTRHGALLGGAILPGLALWPEMLAARTAQLPRVPVVRPRRALGRSPGEAIASGVFFGHVGAVREAVARVRAEAFGRAGALVIATGGNAAVIAREKLFDALEPRLVLEGLCAFAARSEAG